MKVLNIVDTTGSELFKFITHHMSFNPTQAHDDAINSQK